ERRDALGDPDRVIIAVGQERHAVADADALGPCGDKRQEDLGRRRVGVLEQAVMLDLPDAVVAERVGQDRLLQAVVEGLRFGGSRRPGDLHLEKNGELHSKPLRWAGYRMARTSCSVLKRICFIDGKQASTALSAERSASLLNDSIRREGHTLVA